MFQKFEDEGENEADESAEPEAGFAEGSAGSAATDVGESGAKGKTKPDAGKDD